MKNFNLALLTLIFGVAFISTAPTNHSETSKTETILSCKDCKK